jgi:outer membrane lipoprotein-sorting protein
MQYEATFSKWVLNTEIPNSVFEFLPPPLAAEIIMLPQTIK